MITLSNANGRRKYVSRMVKIHKKDFDYATELACQRSMSLSAYLEQVIEAHVAHERGKWYKPAPTHIHEEQVQKSHRGEEVTA